MSQRVPPADRPDRPGWRVTLLGAGFSLLVLFWMGAVSGALPPIFAVSSRPPGPFGLMGTVVISLLGLTVLGYVVWRGSWGQRVVAVLLSPPLLLALGIWLLYGAQAVFQ